MAREKVASSRLREAREACGLSQREVAEALGLVRFTLLRWEKGERDPKESDLKTLSEVYQVSVDWLLGSDDEPSPFRSQERKQKARRKLFRLKGMVSMDTAIGRELLLQETPEWPETKAKDRPGKTQELEGPGVRPSGETLRVELESIAARTQILLNSRPFLPTLSGIHPEVIRAMQEGLVIPTPGLMLALAEKTLVHPSWIMTGVDTWTFGSIPSSEETSEPGT
jgi:transcriptional regulator with XRE-family HTH domain